MSHRKKKKKGNEAVELNLAAMLDMAFQLLTFFILTFKPAPVEGQINLKLPPPMPATKVDGGQAAGSNEANKNPVAALNTLVISVTSTPAGKISQIMVGDVNIAGVPNLDAHLKRMFSAEADAGFEQVVVSVSSRLRYEELMKVVDVCTRQTLPTGEKLAKLSFAELQEEVP